MTARERARAVVQDYHARRGWGYDSVQHAEYETLLAIAIDAAVADALAGERLNTAVRLGVVRKDDALVAIGRAVAAEQARCRKAITDDLLGQPGVIVSAEDRCDGGSSQRTVERILARLDGEEGK